MFIVGGRIMSELCLDHECWKMECHGCDRAVSAERGVLCCGYGMSLPESVVMTVRTSLTGHDCEDVVDGSVLGCMVEAELSKRGD